MLTLTSLRALSRASALTFCAASLALACGGSSSSINGGGDSGTHMTTQPEGGSTGKPDSHTMTPVCKAGSVASCMCGTYPGGTQTCASDGSGYGPCGGCGTPIPEGGPDDGDIGEGDGGGIEGGSGDGGGGGGSSDAGTDSPVTSEAGTDAGEGACAEACATQSPAGFKTFEGDELQSCGCKSNAACSSSCTSECANPSTLTQTSPCGQCLLAQAAEGMGSSCTVGAAISCEGDTQCSTFLNCAEACE